MPAHDERRPLPPLHQSEVMTMCSICNNYKESAREQSRIVDELAGQLEAARATLGAIRSVLADHAASHVYRDPRDAFDGIVGWYS
ncbi:MAG: hypothetical protein ACYC2H_09985 [Thermoplasmatota archaeon]